MEKFLGKKCAPWLAFDGELLRVGMPHCAVRGVAFWGLVNAWGREREHLGNLANMEPEIRLTEVFPLRGR